MHRWLTVVLVAVGTALAAPVGSPADLRAWTPEDSIAFGYFGSPESPADFPEPRSKLVTASPDGKYFFVIHYVGDLGADANVAELLVYSRADLHAALQASAETQQEAPAPCWKVVRRSSSSDWPFGEAMGDVRWQADSSGILFCHQTSSGGGALSRLDVASGEVTLLAEAPIAISDYKLEGEGLVFATWGGWQDMAVAYPAEAVKRIERGNGRRFWGVNEAGGVKLGGYFASFQGRPVVRLPGGASAFQPFRSFGFSRGGSIVLRLEQISEPDIPDRWRNYDNYGHVYDRMALSVSAGMDLKGSPSAQWMVIDLKTGKERPVFGAPLGTSTRAGSAWADSSQRALRIPIKVLSAPEEHMIIVNTALPLTDGNDSAERKAMAYVVDFDSAADRWEIIEPLVDARGRAVTSVSWLDERREDLLITHVDQDGHPAEGNVYRLESGHWRGKAVPAMVKPANPTPKKSHEPLKVEVVQGANAPAVLVASEGERRIVLTEPEAVLKKVWWAKQEQISWQENGKTMTAGLLLPRDRDPAKPLPLVIQTYYYSPQFFLPDGPSKGGSHAAQVMVAQGFAVLQLSTVDLVDTGVISERSFGSGTWEGQKAVERFDTVVEALAQRGIIDPRRVALTGFSRSGYQVHYTITHPGRIHYAAAAVIDSFTGSLPEYLQQLASGNSGDEFPRDLGIDGSFWKNPETWLQRDTVLNADHCRTPVLFSYHGGGRVTGLYEQILNRQTLGVYVENGRPAEMLFFPEGRHQLQRPRERLALMNGILDWLNFWLQNKENPAADRQEQYARWRQMKADWQRQQAWEAAGHPAGSVPAKDFPQ